MRTFLRNVSWNCVWISQKVHLQEISRDSVTFLWQSFIFFWVFPQSLSISLFCCKPAWRKTEGQISSRCLAFPKLYYTCWIVGTIPVMINWTYLKSQKKYVWWQTYLKTNWLLFFWLTEHVDDEMVEALALGELPKRGTPSKAGKVRNLVVQIWFLTRKSHYTLCFFLNLQFI